MRAAAAGWVGLVVVALGTSVRAEEGPLRPTVQVGGRVFARAESSSAGEWSRQLALPSARLSLDAAWGPLLKATVEADVAQQHPLMDAYLKVKLGAGFSLKGGRFKAPFSARELTHPWDLELIHRGIVNATVLDAGFGGRRMGGELGFARQSWLGLKVRLALLKGSLESGEDAAGRISIEPLRGLTLGASAHAKRLGTDGTAYSVDASFRRGRFHLAAEALEAPLTLLQATQPLPPELEGISSQPPPAELVGLAEGATGLAAVRFDLPWGKDVWVEPVAGTEWLRMPAKLPALNAVGGFNVGRGDGLRFQLQAARGVLSAQAAAETRLTAQLGAHF